ncbi:subunit 17 of mediator complex-domain-containing protein [Xylariaceae sp. FL0594]|nr:subunit 17 of mediator complex-domain-containing protein [Xylariaceae sp. FL0594]
MSTNGHPSFSLRPWPKADKRPKTIPEFVARVNAQPGGFRDLDETQLRRELQAKQRGEVDQDGMDRSSDDEDEDEEAGENDGKEKTTVAVRDEFLRNIDFAHQSAMLALDFVSLLLSKEVPVQASTTLSPTLRDLVGIGTLGASRLKDANVTERQKQDDVDVATGWRIMGINSVVDSLLAAADRLENEVDLEVKYWDDVLAVSDDGWTVCALPQQPHMLGVRFGFSESAPEFRNNSIAPLVRNDDGTIKLGVGKAGGGCQRIRVTVKQNGQVIDQSPLPARTPDDGPLNARVREARDTIFHQELWFELNKESRMLLAHDMYYEGSAIVWKRKNGVEMVFTLEDLGERDDAHISPTQGILSASAAYSFLQFLLYQSHRQNYHKRTSPSPALRHSEPNSTYHIMRTLILRFDFFENVEAMVNHLSKLVRTLRHAGISTASVTTSFTPPSSPGPDAGQPRYTPTTELLWVQQLAMNLEARHAFTITPEARVWCHTRGITRPSIGTYFYFSLKPPFDSNSGPVENPLETIYPTPGHCISVQETIYYLCQAASRMVARTVAVRVAGKLGDDQVQWSDSVRGVEISNDKGRHATIDLEVRGERVVLTLTTKRPDSTNARSDVRTWDDTDTPGDADDTIENAILDLMTPA